MQFLSLTAVVAVLSLVASSFAEENNLPQKSDKSDFSELTINSAVKLAAASDVNTDTSNWVQNTFYLGSGCSGSVIMTISLSTGFCFPTSTPGEFQAFSCNSGKILFDRCMMVMRELVKLFTQPLFFCSLRQRPLPPPPSEMLPALM